MLKFSHVTFSVSSQEKPILDTLDLTIVAGEFVVLLGANGSGKSTLLKLISGDYVASKGIIKNESQRLAYLSQDTAQTLFHDLTVLENCCLNGQKIRFTPFKISMASEQADYAPYLKEFHPHLPHKMKTLVKKLSGGERQSLALGLILKQKPDLLLLDEHTSALDPKTAITIMKHTHRAIQDQALTTLMVTHNLQHALDYGTRLIALKEGKIILDRKKNDQTKMTQKELAEIYY